MVDSRKKKTGTKPRSKSTVEKKDRNKTASKSAWTRGAKSKKGKPSRSQPKTKSGAKAPKRKSKRNAKSTKSRSWSRVGTLVLCSLVGVILFLAAGSAYMQMSIKAILRERALTTFAAVVSRPFALAPGVNVEKAHLEQRLTRLRYSLKSSEPTRPGHARISERYVDVYLRGSLSKRGQKQSAQLVRAKLDSQGDIRSLISLPERTKLNVAWLEPETLSLLGNSQRRAVTPTTLVEVSPWIPKALIAIEDERFYSHLGVDPIAIIRAMLVNVRSGVVRQGGSTLTQQLAKNLFYGNERTLQRKAKEAIAAVLIETAFTKDEILELYLNEIFLGQDGRVAIHGFGEAAQFFFSKNVADLTLAEAATLVGIVKAPSSYSPYRHPKRAVARRDVVLGKMLELELITRQQYRSALDTPLRVKETQRSNRKAAFHVDYLRTVLRDAVPLENLSLQPVQIHSGIDVEYQLCAESALNSGLRDLEKRFPRLKRKSKPLQGALVSVVPATGEFIAWVGGRNYSSSQFDHVAMASRQTGSAFKPLVFLTALDAGLNSYRVARTTSLLVDEPVRLEPVGGRVWEPQNYDKKFHGDVTLRETLVRSLNVPTVQLAQKVGIDNIRRTAAKLGVERSLPAVPSLALGAAELTPFELARAYSTIANGGRLTPFRPILSITKQGAQGKLLFEAPLRDSPRISEAAAFVLTDMLASAIDHGTGRSVRTTGYSGPAAGKTGTTNDARDTWFAGYTPRLLTVVWLGYDDNEKTGLTGGQAAAPIWSSYMQCIEGMEPKLEFIPPQGVVYQEIDTSTGLLASSDCDSQHRVTEIFVKGTEPTKVCNAHGDSLFPSFRRADSQRARIAREQEREQPNSRKKSILGSIIDSLWR